MMAAAKIDPFHLVQMLSEFLFNDLNSTLKRIRILLAQGMKMQAIDPFQLFRLEVSQSNTQS
ncbi:hypothetical protein D3C78_1127390 [compost metagenome]